MRCPFVTDFVAALDALAALDPTQLGDGETLVELNRQYERFGAIRSRAAGAFDASGEWQDCGARSAGAWLGGEIGEAQVGLLAKARTPDTEEAFSRDAKSLVEDAERLRFSAFARVLAYWSYHADPDGEEKKSARQIDGRRLHVSQSFGGVWFGDFALDPIRGAVVANELKRLEQELFDADWAEAKARRGREPGVRELRRTPAHRRTDALVEMARRSGTAPAGGRHPEPCFSVLVGYETFAGMICELACEIPTEDRQIDHVVLWSAGGLTIQDNGRPACGFHNRERHHRRE